MLEKMAELETFIYHGQEYILLIEQPQYLLELNIT